MAKALAPLDRAPLLYRSVQEAIKEYILDAGLHPGDMLPPETELARQLGVSRTSVREAVKALESLGLLEVRRGSGLVVREFSLQPLIEHLPYGRFDLDELAEITEIRRVLEVGMIEAAMAAMPAATLDDLRRIIAQMEARAAQGVTAYAEDRLFHQLLFEALGNQTVLSLLDVFWLTFNKASAHVDLHDTDPLHTAADHVAIVEAIAASDVKATRRALDRHYDGLKGRIARARRAREG